MSTSPLATEDDVVALWPSASTTTYDVDSLILRASARLRQRMPSIDQRIATFTDNPTDASALDPSLVADVVAGIVKRYLINPEGVVSASETTGPFSETRNYALRGGKDATSDVRGELVVTQGDVDSLAAPQRLRPFMGTATTRPRLHILSPRDRAFGADGDPILDV